MAAQAFSVFFSFPQVLFHSAVFRIGECRMGGSPNQTAQNRFQEPTAAGPKPVICYYIPFPPRIQGQIEKTGHEIGKAGPLHRERGVYSSRYAVPAGTGFFGRSVKYAFPDKIKFSKKALTFTEMPR